MSIPSRILSALTLIALSSPTLAHAAKPATPAAPPTPPTTDGVVKVHYSTKAWQKQDVVDAEANEKLLAEAIVEGYAAIDENSIVQTQCSVVYCNVRAQTRALIKDPNATPAQ